MDPQMILRLALEAIVSEKTVRRWLADPRVVSARSRIRLERAARALGYPLPQQIAA
jgi:DNA-binding LacI/PurR family transcriptional regulator